MPVRFSYTAADDFAFRPRRQPHDANPLVWLRAALARWRERRALEELDDRALRDMGIGRSQALVEAAKPFWRP
jgi:uncharacterized protein YjiS (DUF1127 family)